ncbi:MAG: hypothetical protein EAX96_04865 [Candidatus Lokiarchaeota archaeon]|nr:hypothetical protein [Candidatus Lokiarchaeota archaeon]
MENEIIKLLTEIVGSITKNNEILVQNNQILLDIQNQLTNMPSGGGGGSADFDRMGTDLKKTISDLQKGFQIMEINRALNDVRELMSYISEQPAQTPSPIKANSSEVTTPPPQVPPKGAPPPPPKTPPEDDGHLLKPSDLFG